MPTRDDRMAEIFYDAYAAVLTTAPEAPTFDEIVGTNLVVHRLSRRRWNRWVIAAAAAVITLLLVGLLPSLLSDDTEPAAPSVTEGWAAFEMTTSRSGDIEYSSVFVARLGEDPIQISPQVGIDGNYICPVFSPDGSLIAYGGGPAVMVAEFDTRSGSVSNVTPHGVEGSPLGTCPQSWAPDGTKLAFLAGNPDSRDGMRGFVLEVETSNVTTLPIAEPLSGLDWSPTADVIALEGTDPGEGLSNVWLLALGSDSADLIPDTGGRVTWSPDGSMLILDQEEVSVVITLDGTVVMNVPGVFASWSPNGEWIAYWGVTSTGGGGQILGGLSLISPTTGEVVGLNTGPYVQGWWGGWLVWTSDSRHILAHADTGWGWDEVILAVSIDPDEPPELVVTAVPIDGNADISGAFSWTDR